MIVTVRPGDDFYVDGSVTVISGTDEHGRRVRFGVDSRMAEDILSAVLFDDETEISVEVEGWQLLGISR